MKYLIILPIVILISLGRYSAQELKQDTLETWYSQFSDLRNITLSPDGNWVAMKKRNYGNTDTAIVLNTQRLGSDPIKFLCSSIPLYTKTSIYGLSKGQFNFANLQTREKYSFENVKSGIGLFDLDRFAVLNKNRDLTVYNDTGKILYSIKGVEANFTSDGKSRLFIQKKGKLNEIIDVSDIHPQVVYSTTNTIHQFLLTPSARHLFILEKNTEKESLVSVFDNQNRKVSMLGVPEQDNISFIRIAEIKKGDYYLIETTRIEEKPEAKTVDIWYGNEGDLAGRNKKITKENYLWKSGQAHLVRLPNDKFSQLVSMNSERYFFAFNPSKGHNYINHYPQYQMYIYDIHLNSYHLLGALRAVRFGSPEVYCSLDSSSVIASEDGKKWTMFGIFDNSKKLIDKEGLNNPSFSTDGKYVIFEGTDDLWKFDIRSGKLSPMKVSSGLTPRIVNFKEQKTQESTYFYRRIIDLAQPLIIELIDRESLSVSFQLLKDGKKSVPIFSSPNKINNNLVYDQKMKSFYTLEENFNFPAKLVKYSKKSSSTMYEIKTLDNTMDLLKKEIIHYTSSEGKKLKGILYYPVIFDPQKKYPMITHIYQVQNNMGNDYLIPKFAMSGFNIRTLLQRGYFVYLPDIVYDKSGTGLSALNCVNRALDAIVNHPNINKNKIGLIGHSHGGYETNFIATRSNRFATYMSGAGNSDIVRSYYSYNYNFTSPFYWQYENGQYEMDKPFAIDKERYLKNSPILHVENVNVPILLWAGKQDENIAWDQVMEFYIGLRRNNKAVIALFYPEQGHGFNYGSKEIMDLSRRQLEWWDYFLKDKTDVLWINKQMRGQ